MQNTDKFRDDVNKYILCLADMCLMRLAVVIHSLKTNQQALFVVVVVVVVGGGVTDSPISASNQRSPQSVLRGHSYNTWTYICINCFSSEFNS